MIKLARWVIAREGGEVTGSGGAMTYRVPAQSPANVYPLADAGQQFVQLRKQLGPEIEKEIREASSEQAAARAAYLAIALDLAKDLRGKHPEGWREAMDCLSGYTGLLEVLFYESPGETGERLRARAKEAGLNAPPRPARK
jgi:hypothetical protein